MGRDMDQLGLGAEDGAFIMGNNAGKAQPLGSDKAVDGLVGIQAVTGKLYWASSATGDTGIQGQTGVKGSTGLQGLTGLSLQGVTGMVGATGVAGSTTDPWIINASAGATGANITNWIYCNFQGVTGVMPFYAS